MDLNCICRIIRPFTCGKLAALFEDLGVDTAQVNITGTAQRIFVFLEEGAKMAAAVSSRELGAVQVLSHSFTEAGQRRQG